MAGTGTELLETGGQDFVLSLICSIDTIVDNGGPFANQLVQIKSACESRASGLH